MKYLNKRRYYGVCSAEALVRGTKTVIWRRPDGSEVEVIGVTSNPDASEYGWSDKRIIGEVTEYVGPGRTR